jgi:hypothetical protein
MPWDCITAAASSLAAACLLRAVLKSQLPAAFEASANFDFTESSFNFAEAKSCSVTALGNCLDFSNDVDAALDRIEYLRHVRVGGFPSLPRLKNGRVST